MKKFIFLLLVISLISLVSAPIISAQSPTDKLRGPRIDKVNEVREKVQDKRQDLRGKIAKIISGEITGILGTTLTVKKDGASYSVNTDSNTKIRRHFWGKGELSEFSAGDKVNAWGTWTDDTKTTILAKMLRNLSIQKRHGIFFGTVKSKDTGNFLMQTLNRGDQTVYFDANTKFSDRKGTTISFADIKTGDRVRIRGLWDKTLNKITEVKEVKDFAIPAKPSNTS